MSETPWSTTAGGVTFTRIVFSVASRSARSWCERFARIEQEVVIAVVEGTVFNDVDLIAVDTADTQDQVLSDLIFKATRSFADALRLQAGIDRSMSTAQVANVCNHVS